MIVKKAEISPLLNREVEVGDVNTSKVDGVNLRSASWGDTHQRMKTKNTPATRLSDLEEDDGPEGTVAYGSWSMA